MAPKKATSTGSTTVYIVVIGTGIDSVHASIESANTRSSDAKDKGKDGVRVEVQQLVGGSVSVNANPTPAAEEKKKPVRAPKTKKAIKEEAPEEEEEEDVGPAPAPIAEEKKKAARASKPKKAIKEETPKEEELEDEEEEESKPAPPTAPAPKAKATTKKTVAPAEQRAQNAAKPAKSEDADLPDNVKALLKSNGNQLDGLRIVVTGVPPVLGRKNAEKLVQLYGGNLTKSLSKNTSFVVVGNDAGPTKLEKIADLGITTWDENELIALIEKPSNGLKRSASAEEDDEEEDKKPAVAKPKKRKTTKS